MGIVDRVSAAVTAFISGGAPVTAAAPPETDNRAAKLAVTGAANAPSADKRPVILGPNVTPALIAIALRDAERGRMRRLCDLNSEMRETVPHMQSELGKREKALARCAIVVKPADTTGMGARAEKQAKKIAEYVRTRVGEIEDFSDSIEHMQGGVFQGRSGCEKEHFRDKRGIGIRRLIPVMPKRFSYAANWRIHLWDEAGNDNDNRLGIFPGVDVREEWPDKFVIHEPRTLGSEMPTRQGLGRVLVWAGMFWKGDARFWMEFAELYANPWRMGSYAKTAGAKDIAALETALINMSGMSTAVFPEGCKPYFLQVRDTKTHADLAAMWCAEISKVINGGTLATSMNGASGSRAAGEVHEREGEKLTAGDGMAMDETLRRDVARPLVRLNFGAEAAQLYTPFIHLVTERPEDVEKRAGRIWAFVDHGGEADMDEVRDVTTGLSKPKKGAKLLVPMAAIGPIAKAASEAANADVDTEDGEEPTDAKDDKPVAEGEEEDDDKSSGADPDENDEDTEDEDDEDK